MTEEDLIKTLQKPRTGQVSGLNDQPLCPSLPRYLVWPPSVPTPDKILSNPVKIIDFGESFTQTNKPTTLHTPLAMRAPEIILRDNWDHRVDLWSLGCTVRAITDG